MELSEKDKAIVEEIKVALNKNIEGKVSKEEMDAAIAEATKNLKAEDKIAILEKAISDQGIAIKGLKEQATQSIGHSIAEQIKSEITSRKKEWEDFISNKQSRFEFNLKNAGTIVAGHISGNNLPVAQVEAGLTDIVSVQPAIIPLCNYGPAASPTIQFTQKVNRDGTAALVNDTTISPLIDFDLSVGTSTSKDATATIKVHVNMLSDIDFMASEINNELKYEVNLLADNSVLAAIINASPAFVMSTVAVTTPNNFDCIQAAASQCISLNFQPNIAVVNPIDYANMVMGKTSVGEYVMPPFSAVNGTTVAGLRLVQSNQVGVGYLLVGDFTKVNVRELQNFTATMGWENTDFRDRVVSLLGVRRLHYYIKTNHDNGFVYDQFTDIISAIVTP